ncbi:MAG: S1C family serine protease [Chloroflexi bacterium]|nr:S1C family serine protease [Chloroflexota bacterium]
MLTLIRHYLPRPRFSPAIYSAFLAAVLLMACNGNASATPSALDISVPGATPTLVEVLADISDAVVQIRTPNGNGSGFIIDGEEGLVLTNAHVVEDFAGVTAYVQNVGVLARVGVSADVVGKNDEIDLALIRLVGDGEYHQLDLDYSEKVALGQEVIALGYPLASILGDELTISRGVVSSSRIYEGVNYIQTDASVNPGNSGGPLVDAQGNVIGITTAKLDLSDLGIAVEGVSFAISVDEINKLIPSLMAGGGLSGLYTGTFSHETQGTETDLVLELNFKGDNLNGRINLAEPFNIDEAIDGSVEGSKITFRTHYSEGNQVKTISFEGSARTSNRIAGTFDISPTRDTGTWIATRE